MKKLEEKEVFTFTFGITDMKSINVFGLVDQQMFFEVEYQKFLKLKVDN